VRPAQAIVLGVALLLKIALGATLLIPGGFEARYYDNPRFEGPIQPSAEPREASFTRIDRRLRFGADGSPDVPVGFFNELRFGFFGDTAPRRDGLPFSIMWQGLWRVTSPGRQQLYVHSPGGAVTLTIGDALSEQIACHCSWTGEVDLPPGFHRVMIAWSSPAGRRAAIRGRPPPRSAAKFRSTIASSSSSAPARSRSRRTASCAWAAGCSTPSCSHGFLQVAQQAATRVAQSPSGFNAADAVSLVWMIGILDAVVFAAPAIGRMVTPAGGDDWLTYESQARDIVLHGPLMTSGEALDTGRRFSRSRSTRTSWPPATGCSATACLASISSSASRRRHHRRALARDGARVRRRSRAGGARHRRRRGLPETGGLVGRPSYRGTLHAARRVVGVPPGSTRPKGGRSGGRQRHRAARCVGRRDRRARDTDPFVVVGWVVFRAAAGGRRDSTSAPLGESRADRITMVAVASLATVRNWVVAHRLILITTEGAPTLLLGNPTPPLDETPPALKAWYARLNLDPSVERVVEFARQQPRQFAAGWHARRNTRSVGSARCSDGAPTSRFYIACLGGRADRAGRAAVDSAGVAPAGAGAVRAGRRRISWRW
jgi:hypothetical protein